ncbi:MAG TPA: hypothetical protein VFA21_07300 [Pyrinomonadaceae bacterium]|jgi:hypothetical protein|nr:hypothetical protein [Pyrinomonadaceae bacterium]
MFDVTLTNNYVTGVFVDGGNRIFEPGQTYQLPNLSGQHTVRIYGMGDINIIDLGDKKLAPYTNPKIPWTEKTWGGVVRYRGLDAYFRYEGNGHITIVIDQVGSISLHFDQGGMMVNLADMTVG